MNPHYRTDDSIAALYRYKKCANRFENYFVKTGKMDRKMYRLSVNNFLDSITQLKWDWYNEFEENNFFEYLIKNSILKQRVIPNIEVKRKKRISCYPMTKVSFSIAPENFYEAAKKHIYELLELMGADFNKTIVLDQPFSGNNPQCSFPFFDSPKAIVVDRDPRDNYVFGMTRLIGRNHFMPLDNVIDFVKYYKSIRDKQPYLTNSSDILRLQFEELVYDYDIGTKKIREFLNIGDNPNPKSIFNPDLSINNTQVWKRFPQYSKDIEYIENNLSEYLFDFDKYGKKKISGEMFFGKSPLHRK